MITREERLLREQPPAAWLPGILGEFLRGLPRLERLHRYALGRHDILGRTRGEGLPNIRLPHGFPRYIAQMSAGYLLGEPVRYQTQEEGEALAAFTRLCQSAGADQADTRLALQQAVYGRGISLCYQAPAGGAKIAVLDPRAAFLVYDDTVAHQPLMGVHIAGEKDRRGRPDGARVTLYTGEERLCFQAKALPEAGPLLSRSRHPFGRVPMVEYLNEEEAHGDFEEVLPLIDAYDSLASDRLNDRAQFADALLVLTGVMGLGTAEDPFDHRAGIQRLRQDKTLTLPDADASAQWLVKNPLEKDIDTLRNALAGDIHKFSMTPDFGDERFSGNTSGIAIKYKLFCLDQRIRLKERWFADGLRERAAVLANWLRGEGLPAPDPLRLTIRFTRQLPESGLERAQTEKLLAGLDRRPDTDRE
ncbi:MAG: phage portal protein [Christensenellales bacterium]